MPNKPFSTSTPAFYIKLFLIKSKEFAVNSKMETVDKRLQREEKLLLDVFAKIKTKRNLMGSVYFKNDYGPLVDIPEVELDTAQQPLNGSTRATINEFQYDGSHLFVKTKDFGGSERIPLLLEDIVIKPLLKQETISVSQPDILNQIASDFEKVELEKNLEIEKLSEKLSQYRDLLIQVYKWKTKLLNYDKILKKSVETYHTKNLQSDVKHICNDSLTLKLISKLSQVISNDRDDDNANYFEFPKEKATSVFLEINVEFSDRLLVFG